MRTEAAPDPLAGRRVLIAVCGGIAAVKVPGLVSRLVQRGARVRCLLTPSAERLVSGVALATLSRERCYRDADQWRADEPRPLHIALAEWAELVLVAPLGATSLARWVHGFGDGLLAGTLLACEAPLVAAAAMNTAMWRSEPVQRNWRQLAAMPHVLPVAPASGLLACDRRGDGRMADPEVLLLAMETALLRGTARDWRDRTLLVSAGPTCEPLDPAREISNRSSGRMGVLLAQAGRLRGARVSLVHGPLQVPEAWLEGLSAIPVRTAAEMGRALSQLQPQATAVAMVAAVSDLRRSHPVARKLAKGDLLASLQEGWEEAPDLLADLVASRPAGQVVLGFAAESGDVLTAARAKRRRKGCELLFANPIDVAGVGFGGDRNGGWLLGPGDRCEPVSPRSKLALGHHLLSAMGALLPGSSPAGGAGAAPSTGC
jgi:phosphopantothenoylcysteine decarboxylase/phosphopantothenate--cysteine ligase